MSVVIPDVFAEDWLAVAVAQLKKDHEPFLTVRLADACVRVFSDGSLVRLNRQQSRQFRHLPEVAVTSSAFVEAVSA